MDQLFNINGKQFASLGKITINNHTYLVTENSGEMVLVEAIKTENGYTYTVPSMSEADPQRFKGVMFTSEIIKNIKKDIDSGIITSKDELQKRISKASNILEKDVKLNSSLQNQGIEEFKANLKELYDYFDQQVKTTSDVDFSNYASITTETGQELFVDKNDQTQVLENNDKDHTLKEQMNDKVNEQLINGESVKEDEAYDKLEESHKIHEMENVNNMDVSKIGLGQTSGQALVGYELAKELDSSKGISGTVNYNASVGVGMDADGNVISTTSLNNSSSLGLNKGGDINAQTGEATKTDMIASTDNVENPYGINPDEITLEEVDALLGHRDEIANDIVVYLEGLREQKLNEEEEKKNEQGMNKEAAKVKVMVPPGGKPHVDDSVINDNAAYVNLIVLCLFVQLFMLIIIIGTIFIMK